VITLTCVSNVDVAVVADVVDSRGAFRVNVVVVSAVVADAVVSCVADVVVVGLIVLLVVVGGGGSVDGCVVAAQMAPATSHSHVPPAV
jgi:hypothetical protein